MSPDEKALHDLEAEIACAVEESFFDTIVGLHGFRYGGEVYETEETDEAFGPIVLVRKSDAARFEVYLDVSMRTLPPKPTEPDPDAPVHIEGQEEIPLEITARP